MCSERAVMLEYIRVRRTMDAVRARSHTLDREPDNLSPEELFDVSREFHEVPSEREQVVSLNLLNLLLNALSAAKERAHRVRHIRRHVQATVSFAPGRRL